MNKLYLHQVHQKAGAHFIPIRDQEIPGDYGDIESELKAIKQNVSLLDRSYLGKISLTGPDSLDILNRISTNDLQQLAVGTMCDTLFVTPKGRLIDYCRVIKMGEELILIGSFFHSSHLIDWINRFVILEDVEVKDVSAEYAWLTLIGPHAKQFIGQLSNKLITDGDEAIWIKINGQMFPALKNTNLPVW